MHRAQFTKEALEICTPQQIEAVCRLISDYHEIQVSKSFDIEGWLDFTLEYHKSSYEDQHHGLLYGGISPEGDAHT
jgi:hypothetical protein